VRRTELHFHLLPEVDDGPVDLGDAVELARLAVADGTGVVTVTPHVRDLLALGILDELPARVREVQAALRRAQVDLEVQAGAELAHEDVPALDDGQLDAIAHGPAGRRWVLIEAPLFGDAPGFLDATAELRARGFATLIGHPERCGDLMRMDGAIDAERAAGALLQVNASSITGRHGQAARAWGIELLRGGRADVIASDAHGAARPPQLGAALDVLAVNGIPPAQGEALAAAAPHALLLRGLASEHGARAA
jgi:protein-tyrosine phosphatase